MDSPTPTTSTVRRCSTCSKALRGSIYDHLCPACERAESIALLRKWCPPGSTVYTNLHHVSRSGMSRTISLHVSDKDGIQNITGHAARVLGYNLDTKNLAVKVSGCGMDMGFNLVYNLSSVLYRDAFVCTGKKSGADRCPSNDHNNGDRNYRKHKHTDGGYALSHRWI